LGGTVKIYTRTGDAGDTSLFGGTRARKSDPRVDAYGEVDELNAWLGLARASAPDPALADELVHLQRDLFALGAQLADPADKIAARVTKATLSDGDTARLEQLIDRLEADLPPLRRFILAAARRLARPSTWRAPSAAARSAASSRSIRRRSGPAALRQPAIRPVVRARPHGDHRPVCQRSSGSARHQALNPSLRSSSRFTASNTALASSCDTRSRIAPHSTIVVPATVSMATSQRSRAIPSGRSFELRRLSHGRLWMLPRHIRGDRRAVDQYAHGDDQILVDGTLSVVEARRILAEQHEVIGCRNLGDDRPAECTLRITGALPRAAKRLERRRQACRHEDQHEGRNCRQRISHRYERGTGRMRGWDVIT